MAIFALVVHTALLAVAMGQITPQVISNKTTSFKRYVTDFTKGEECLRKCDGIPKNCYFKFVIERYVVMGGACKNCSYGALEDCLLPQCVTANGHLRSFISVNRQLPGPSLQLCLGDRLTVDVENRMPDETTTVHWHGIKQIESQYYDGVPYVTQCPILPGNSFRYTFIPDEAGTYFYHSHTAIQKFDGLTGALIVKNVEQKENLYSLYDEDLAEHVLLIQDWTNIPGENYIPGFNSHELSQKPDAYLLNGRSLHYSNTSGIKLPLSEFIVEKGKRYRFRIIGSTCLTCAISIKFQGHKLLAITADGGLRFTPVHIDTVVLNSADRFDVVLEANQTEGVYYILLQGLNSCRNIHTVGLLRYNKITKTDTVDFPLIFAQEELGVVLNSVGNGCDPMNTNEICISMLEGIENAVEQRNSKRAYKQIPIAFGFYKYDDNDLFRSGTFLPYDEPVPGFRSRSLINNITFAFPPSTLISQYSDIPLNTFCDEECYNTTAGQYCICTNLYRISSGTIVDLLIYDTYEKNGFSHPFHLHGFNFYVLEMGIFKGSYDQRSNELASLSHKLREDNLNLKSRPMKDTISVPDGGYVLIRFTADNPGFWIFHCHLVFHLEGGMAAVLKVGDSSQLPPEPLNFPKCGKF